MYVSSVVCRPVRSAVRSPPRRSKLLKLIASFRSLGASVGGAVYRRKAAAIEMSIGYPPFGPALLGAEESLPPTLFLWLRRFNAPSAPILLSLYCPALNSALSISCSYGQVLLTCFRKIFLLTLISGPIYTFSVRRPAYTPISSGTQPRYPHPHVGSGVSLISGDSFNEHESICRVSGDSLNSEAWRFLVARLLSIIASVIRGSVGGLTYSSNQFHQIIVRARTAPVNPNTSNQTTIRSAFNVASQAWKVMATPIRLAWEEYAESLTYEGPLGPYTMPGRQVCIGNLSMAGYIATRGLYALVPSAAAPITPGFLDVGNITVGPAGAGETGFLISVENPNLFDVVIFAQRSVNFGTSRYRFKGPYLSDTDIALKAASETTFPIPFYDLIKDAIYFVRLRAITEEGPYRISTEYFLRCISVETPIAEPKPPQSRSALSGRSSEKKR